MKEIEVKARIEDIDFLMNKLNKLNCKLSQPIIQKYRIFIPKDCRFPPEYEKACLRIRDSNGKFTLTLKKRIKNGLDKIKHEIIINNTKEAEEILKDMDRKRKIIQ